VVVRGHPESKCGYRKRNAIRVLTRRDGQRLWNGYSTSGQFVIPPRDTYRASTTSLPRSSRCSSALT
jgi:hypothetical protein